MKEKNEEVFVHVFLLNSFRLHESEVRDERRRTDGTRAEGIKAESFCHENTSYLTITQSIGADRGNIIDNETNRERRIAFVPREHHCSEKEVWIRGGQVRAADERQDFLAIRLDDRMQQSAYLSQRLSTPQADARQTQSLLLHHQTPRHLSRL